MENKLVISLSPHVHGGDSVKKNMYGVLIALIPDEERNHNNL